MFTGLIEDLGHVLDIERAGAGATLRIHTALGADLSHGDSIAVNGVCLTATALRAREAPAVSAAAKARELVERGAWELEAQAIPETLARTTLGALTRGDSVNLELPLRADGRLGGHIVQGHVDGVGIVAEVREDGDSRVLAIDAPAELLPLIVEKGSIALDGVSLTVSALGPHGFEVSLIPETLQRTTLGGVSAGARVNLEVDILAKHVERLLCAGLARRTAATN